MGDASAATVAVIVVSALLLLGYIAGSRINRRRARDSANWLRAGLRTLGGEPRFSRLGAVGFTATVDGLRGPLTRVDAATIFIPREVPPLWLARRLTGATDLLTLRATLEHPPSLQGDAIDPSSTYGRRAAGRIARDWPRASARGLLVAAPGQDALQHMTEVVGWTDAARLHPQILSVRRATPHLLLTLAAPASEAETVRVIGEVRALAEELGRLARQPGTRATPR